MQSLPRNFLRFNSLVNSQAIKRSFITVRSQITQSDIDKKLPFKVYVGMNPLQARTLNNHATDELKSCPEVKLASIHPNFGVGRAGKGFIYFASCKDAAIEYAKLFSLKWNTAYVIGATIYINCNKIVKRAYTGKQGDDLSEEIRSWVNENFGTDRHDYLAIIEGLNIPAKALNVEGVNEYLLQEKSVIENNDVVLVLEEITLISKEAMSKDEQEKKQGSLAYHKLRTPSDQELNEIAADTTKWFNHLAILGKESSEKSK